MKKLMYLAVLALFLANLAGCIVTVGTSRRYDPYPNRHPQPRHHDHHDYRYPYPR